MTEEIPGLSNEDILLENYFYSKKGNILNSQKITKINIVPTDNDYSYGYIERYFAKQTNNSNSIIIEIDKTQYDIALTSVNCIYSVGSLFWKITGTIKDIIDYNNKSIIDADKIFSGIKKLLEKNLLQFNKEKLT